mgnify:CR=1 FL=1
MSVKTLTLTALATLLLVSPAMAQMEGEIPPSEGEVVAPAPTETPAPVLETAPAPTETPAATTEAAPVVETPAAEAPAATTETPAATETTPATTETAPVEQAAPAETTTETAPAAVETPAAPAEEPKPVKKVVKKYPQDPALAFLRYDVDGDNALSKTEFDAAGIVSGISLFNSMDTDKDGMLSKSEINIFNNGPN